MKMKPGACAHAGQGEGAVPGGGGGGGGTPPGWQREGKQSITCRAAALVCNGSATCFPSCYSAVCITRGKEPVASAPSLLQTDDNW